MLWKVWFPYQHVTWKHWLPTQLTQTPLNAEACSKTSEILFHWTSQLPSLFHPLSNQTYVAAFVAAAALVECALVFNPSRNST